MGGGGGAPLSACSGTTCYGPLRLDRRFLGAGRPDRDQRQRVRARGRARRARQPAGARAARCCFGSTIVHSASPSKRRRPSSPLRACRSAPPRRPIGSSWPASALRAYARLPAARIRSPAALLQSGISSRAQFEQTQHARASGAVAAQFGAAAGRQRAGAARRQSRLASGSAPGGDAGAGGTRQGESRAFLYRDPRSR